MIQGKYEIGETVIYKGREWEIADHLNGTYAIWQKDKNGKVINEIIGWLPGYTLSTPVRIKE